MAPTSKRLALAALTLAALQAQPAPRLRLKSGRVPQNLLWQAAPPATESRGLTVRRADSGRFHFILQFETSDAGALVDELGFRDIRVLQYVPDNALLVSAPQDADVSDLGAVYQALLGIEDKVSGLLPQDDPERAQTAVLEVHPDVARSTAVEIALQSGLEILDHPDLPLNTLLVRGSMTSLQAAAGWDETAYLYPAAGELLRGEPVIPCTGGVMAAAAINGAANLATSFGDGWDGPGLGAASLAVYVGGLPSWLDPVSARGEIQRALAAWSSVVQITFYESSMRRLRRQIEIFAASREHGDGFPFDGRGGVLAHTFYPPPNAETIAGDLHLDVDEPWKIGADMDLFPVVLHELGHALGLGHNDDPNSVMYPYYRRHSGLQAADVAEIRKLYAARIAPPPAGPSTPTTPTPPPTTPATPPPGPPAPPSAPNHPPSTPPSNDPPPSADTSPPKLQITFPYLPVYATTATAITLRGSATDNTAVREVFWSTRTASGAATGPPAAFSAGPVPLVTGINPIAITASDAAGNITRSTVIITRR